MNSSQFFDFIRVSAYTLSLSILLPLLSIYTSQLITTLTSPPGLEEKINILKMSRDSLQDKESELSKIAIKPSEESGMQNGILKKEMKELNTELQDLQNRQLKHNNLISLIIASIIGILALLFSYFSSSNYLSPGALIGGTFCLISATTYTNSLMTLVKVISLFLALMIIVLTAYRQSKQQ